MKKDTLNALLEEISHNAAFDELAALQKALDEGIDRSDIIYARCFHALAILKVPKDDVEVDGKDHLLSAFFQLWLRDDGSKGAWRSIEAISWSISEEIKLFKRKRR